ncbi:MAG: peptidyl-prolyl cis-trans isomerase [Planctomycetes bacterium]|nr:peptidyl-prolyl cis-trans isomerase [Planctomycetota bacterium]
MNALHVPLLLLAAAGALVAQEPAGEAPSSKLVWPKDQDRAVCTVAGRDYTLKQLLEHIAERHYPPMLKLMETASGRSYLESPRLAEWVRAFADSKALELEAADRGIGFDAARDALGEALKRSFEDWLKSYRERREREGAPLELTQERVNLLLTDHQRDEGLRTEVDGWLDALVPAIPLEAHGKLRDWYEDHPQYFGGVVNVAQILIEHRDPRTLELKVGTAQAEAQKKLADVRARIAPDGANFEEVARAHSDDRRTAREGGRLDGILRFDQRLPAALCRTAWRLKDGEVSEPFESPFGIHIVKRIGYTHRYYVIFTDQIKPEIAATMRKEQQEELLFGVRERRGVTLRY